MKHECVCCHGTGYQAYKFPDPPIMCDECNGNGELEECQCCAYEPSECICGAWDDIDLNKWYSLEEE